MSALALQRLRPGSLRLSTPAPFIASAILIVGASALLSAVVRPDAALVVDTTQQIVAMLVALGVLVWGAVGARGGARRLCIALTIALVVGGLGMLAWDVQASQQASPPITEACLVAASAILIVAIGADIFMPLDRTALVGVVLDASIFRLAVVAGLLTVWRPDAAYFGRAGELPAVGAAVLLAAASAGGWFALLARRVQPGIRGSWAMIDGMLVLGISWIGWLDLAARGKGADVVPVDFLFSVGVLLVAHGAVSRDVPAPATDAFRTFAERGQAALPLLAVLFAVGLEALSGERRLADEVALSGVMVLAVARMAWLARAERVARLAERRAAARLAWELEERADTLVSLSRLEPAESPEATAQRICGEALRLRGVEAAVVKAITPEGALVPLGMAGLDPEGSVRVGQPLPESRAAYVRERARQGVWVDVVGPEGDDPRLAGLREVGLRALANAPMRWGEQTVGVVSLGARSPDAAGSLADRLPTMREFGVVAGALLGPSLAERERLARIRSEILDTIETRAFHPVFQPVVDLAAGHTVGYEALTRFDDGTRPDVRFAEAAAAGLSVDLEQAALSAAIAEARALPAGAWLSLNLSPALAPLSPLIAALAGARRELVLEITEHVPVEDYAPLLRALGEVRPGLRIAVDDAGVGYAGLRHILELRPDFVKLDIALVRSIDSDPARRAMVEAMARFAAETDCALIAEGIETPEELATLREIGVAFGQGYLLGRPTRV